MGGDREPERTPKIGDRRTEGREGVEWEGRSRGAFDRGSESFLRLREGARIRQPRRERRTKAAPVGWA